MIWSQRGLHFSGTRGNRSTLQISGHPDHPALQVARTNFRGGGNKNIELSKLLRDFPFNFRFRGL